MSSNVIPQSSLTSFKKRLIQHTKWLTGMSIYKVFPIKNQTNYSLHEMPSGWLDANNLGADKSATVYYSYSSPYYYPRCDEFLRVQVIHRPEGEYAACTADFRFENFIQGNSMKK